jgi:hypothetical protein
MIVKLQQITDRVTPDIMRSWALDIEKAFGQLAPLVRVPNTLFTPTLYGGTTAGTPTYTIQQGQYTKTGNVVHFKLRIDFTAKTGIAGALKIGGLPFLSYCPPGLSLYDLYQIETNAITPAAGLSVYAEHAPSVNSLSIYANGAPPTAQTDAQLAASGYIIISGSYQTAS